jgi:acyl-CoA thioesterase II
VPGTPPPLPAAAGEQAPGLTALLELEQAAPQVFRAGPRSSTAGRVFGGAVAAQALLAAGRTVVADRAVHSLHAYFVRPADASLATDYRVQPVRDGGSYTTRRVSAEQRGEVVLELSASFSVAEEGFAHQVPQLDAPDPDGLPGPEEARAGTDGMVREWFGRLPGRHPFELRFAEPLPRIATGRGELAAPRQRFWFRCRDRLPAEPLVHSCAVTYASDMLLLSSSLGPHGTMIGAPDLRSASLDHAVWFHSPVRADEWLFYDQESSWAAGGRTLCSGRIFDRSGRLVLTVAQEGMIRHRPAAG